MSPIGISNLILFMMFSYCREKSHLYLETIKQLRVANNREMQCKKKQPKSGCQSVYSPRSLGLPSPATKSSYLGWWHIMLYLKSVQILPMHILHVHTYSSYSYALDQAWSRGKQLLEQCRTVVIYTPKQRIPTTPHHRTLPPQSNPAEQDSSAKVGEQVGLLWSPHCSWVNAIKESQSTDHRKGGSPKP